MRVPDERRITVVAAVIERNGAFLLTRRPHGTHLEGCWEFPGGKCEAGETHAECLGREIAEELGVAAHIESRILSTVHAYEDRTIELHFYRCELVADPHPMLGQDMQWAPRAALDSLQMPPADAELIARLKTGN